MGSKRKRNKGSASRGHWYRGVTEPDESSLNTHVRRALACRSPFDMLSMVSLLLSYSDPRPTEMFDRSKRSEWAPGSRANFVEAAVANPAPEASALLAVVAEFLGEEDELARRIRAALVDRPPLRPNWLARLGDTRIVRAVRMSHVLDEWDHVLMQGQVPATGGDFTCIVSLDVVGLERIYFGGVVPGHIDDVVAMIDVPDADFRSEEVDLADVRARLVKAIGWESHLPPQESETWPGHRALVEWLLRLLPDGGSAEPRPELDHADDGVIVRNFLGSPQGALFGRRHRPLVESLVEFEGGAGDPLRWNVRRAEKWLFDHVLDDLSSDELDGREVAPYLLRAYVRFAHDEVGIRPELTDGVLEVIESWETEYQEKLRRKRDDEADWFDVAAGG